MTTHWPRPAGLHTSVARLPVQGRLPAFDGATEWLNSPPLTPASLRGKVVLVNFWTYTCINWLRQLPYVRAWAGKYSDRGLVVIGAHTPEFGFEHDLDNVRRAVQDMRVDYPVAIDNDYAVWSAFANHYWPALYFADAQGHIRHHHFGEGEYQQSEMVIQYLLAEAGPAGAGQELVSPDAHGAEAPADWATLRSPENYTGYERTENFASPGGAVPGKRHPYQAPAQLRLNHWALSGDWTMEDQAVTLDRRAGPRRRPVPRHNPPECQAACPPHIPARYLVEPGEADANQRKAHGTMTTESGPGPGRPDPGLSAIGARRHLIDLAYRLLGSLAEAEDAVQEAYARWYAMSRQQQQAIASPGAWLTTVASRICLDVLGSARARRERYVGPWIPEPLPDPTDWAGSRPGDAAVDPADRVTLDESVAMAFLVVLESMTPAERVAFILHDVFGYPFADIAEITGRTPAACRQLASSGRRRIRASQAPAAPAAHQAGIVRAFRQAWETKDIHALICLLDPAATVIGDGGGLVRAVLRPIEGDEQIARFFVDLAGRIPSNVTCLERTVNGQPGLVLAHDGVIVTVFAFGVAGDRIRDIWVVRNPEKLRLWTTWGRAPGYHRVR